jgi:hypothetical protein
MVDTYNVMHAYIWNENKRLIGWMDEGLAWYVMAFAYSYRSFLGRKKDAATGSSKPNPTFSSKLLLHSSSISMSIGFC